MYVRHLHLLLIISLLSFRATYGRTINVQPGTSIQWAIDLAVPGDTILVAPGTYNENLVIEKKLLTLCSQYIREPFESLIAETIIDGSQNGSVLDIAFDETEKFSLIGFTIRNGNADWGGGISGSRATLYLSHLRIRNNSAKYNGGGIYLYLSKCYLTDVLISENTACLGGGIYTSGHRLTFDQQNRCSIFDNSGNFGVDIYSGDRFLSFPTTVFLDTHTVKTPTDYYIFPGKGFQSEVLFHKKELYNGDLFVSANGNNANDGHSEAAPLKTISKALSMIQVGPSVKNRILVSAGEYIIDRNNPVYLMSGLTISGTTPEDVVLCGNKTNWPQVIHARHVSNCKVKNLCIKGGHPYQGIRGEYSSFSVENVHISKNNGGIYLDECLTDISNSVIAHNSSTSEGGGLYLFRNCEVFLSGTNIFSNSAGREGGGIHCNHSTLRFDEISRCNVYSNTAPGARDIFAKNSGTIHLVVDTFTVVNPNETHLTPLDSFTWNILNGKFSTSFSVLYVSPLGSDKNSGLNHEEPLGSISQALSMVSPDSLNPTTIHVAEGIYSPSRTNEKLPLIMQSHTLLKGVSRDECFIDGEAHQIMRVFNCENVRIENLTLRNGKDFNNEGAGIRVYASSVSLSDLFVDGCFAGQGGGISFNNSNAIIERLIAQNNTSRWAGSAINIQTSAVTINRSLFTKNEMTTGVVNVAIKSKVRILNSTIAGNVSPARYGFNAVHISSDADAIILNSIIRDNLPFDFDIEGQTLIAYSNFDPDGMQYSMNDSILTLYQNLHVNPLFTDTSAVDYSLSEASLCIDAGIPFFVWQGDTILSLTEMEYSGSGPDMGAFEFGHSDVFERKSGQYNFPEILNYPNPFNGSTQITFTLPHKSDVHMILINQLGQIVFDISKGNFEAGRHEIRFDASGLASGVYILRLAAGDLIAKRKLMLIQ